MALAVSPSGDWLASGGQAELLIWDMATYQGRRLGSCNGTTFEKSGAMEQILVTSFYAHKIQELFFKEAACHQIANGVEITCLTAHHETSRIAVGMRDSVVQIWCIEANNTLSLLWSIKVETTMPQGISFRAKGGCELDVFRSFDGQYTIKSERSQIVEKQNLCKTMTSSAICHQTGLLVIANLANGFDLHQFDSGAYIRTLATPSLRRISKKVAFGEGGQLVAGGSDHGYVYVFNTATGDQVDALRHSKSGLVQVITTFDSPKRSLIICGSSDGTVKPTISIWNHIQKPKKEPRLTPSIFMEITVKLFVTLAALAVLAHYVKLKDLRTSVPNPAYRAEGYYSSYLPGEVKSVEGVETVSTSKKTATRNKMKLADNIDHLQVMVQ
ncbi:hypothetical protein Clacol_009731 [Clathrus columnatus]|uniref:Uncharacterized protein n=1 Tax=Clathrus columnatus TaxID=1419009 RepID=A0AAV5APL7_9AGAM|nr:hypothetical protein Clacol_009731 [Clathrus columnatus]